VTVRPPAAGDLDLAVGRGELGPVAHEAAEPAGLGRLREQHEVVPRPVGAEELRTGLGRLGRQLDLRARVVELTVELGQPARDRPEEPR